MLEGVDKVMRGCGRQLELQAHFFNDDRVPRMFSKDCVHERLAAIEYFRAFGWKWALYLDAKTRVLRSLFDITSAISQFKESEVMALVPQLNKDSGAVEGWEPGGVGMVGWLGNRSWMGRAGVGR